MRTLTAALASFVLCAAAPARADTLHEALEAYALYQHDVGLLADLPVENAAAINGAVARIARHDPDRVARGFIAYGALTAAQSPGFVAGVNRQVQRDGRADVLAQLRGDPAWARREAKGASQAIGLILSAARADSDRAMRAGDRYEHMARNSRARWITSKDRTAATLTGARLTPEMRERLGVGALQARPMQDAGAFGGARFWDTLAGRDAAAPQSGGGREQRTHVDVTNRMLTAGALLVAGAGEGSRVSALLDEPITRHCLNMQRLQLRQCLAVSVDASERTYCLARHGLTGPGTCFSAMAR